MLALDVDGVLTNGQVILGNNGQEFKAFNIRDGLGIKLAQEAGIVVAIITGRTSEVVERRAAELGITEIYQGIGEKLPVLHNLIEKYGLSMTQVAYIGDDLNDLPIIKSVGFGATVADGAEEVKKHAVYVSPLKGGKGAVREVLEFILKSQAKWDKLIAKYL